MFKLIKICVNYQNVMKTKANEEKVSPRETQYSYGCLQLKTCCANLPKFQII